MMYAKAVAAVLALLAGAAMGQVGYIPPSTTCPPNTLVSVQASSSRDAFGNVVISGTVLLQNGGTSNLPFNNVIVQLSNNIPVAPIYVTASCPGNSIPYDPQPYTYGELTCSFAATVPAGGIASSPSAWTLATATLNLPGGATCSSKNTPISHQNQPIVYSTNTGTTGTSSPNGRKLLWV